MRKVLFVLFLLCFLQAPATKKEGEKRKGNRIEEIWWEFFKYLLLLSLVYVPSCVTVFGVWMWDHLDRQQRLRLTLVITVALAVLALSNSLIWTWSNTVLDFGKQYLEHLALALSSGVVAFVWAVFYYTDPPPPPPTVRGSYRHTVEHGLPVAGGSLLGTIRKMYNNYVAMALMGFIMALCVNLGDGSEEKQPIIIPKHPIAQDYNAINHHTFLTPARLTGKLGAACVCIYAVGRLFSLPIYFKTTMVAIYVLIMVAFVIYGDLRDSEYIGEG